VRKYKKVIVAKAPLAISLKEVYCKAKQTQCESNMFSGEARHAQCEPLFTSGKVCKTVL